MARRKILFLSEAVTWSQVVRLVTLAKSLDPEQFEISFAASRFDEQLFGDASFARKTIFSLTPEQVDTRLRRGTRIYDRRTLARYVDQELQLIDELKPDLIVSDLRWSTAISAPSARVKLATLIDAYWFRGEDQFPIPDHPVVRWLGVERVKKGFALGLPFVLRHFAAPVNQLREARGLSPLNDLRDVLAFGDALLFPDDSALVPCNRPGTYLGPISWSPDIALPSGWDELGRDRPLVYLTLGSSGPAWALEKILDALSTFELDILLSSAGRPVPRELAKNVRVVGAVRGDLAAKKARVVFCSGGASTGWQALAQGTPVIGMPSNLDAMLAMSCIDRAGAGISLRSSATVPEIRAAVARGLRDDSLRTAASAVARSFSQFDPAARFRAVVDQLTA